MSQTVTDSSAVSTDAPTTVETLIIGSGFSGLGAAIKLSQEGKSDYVVIERGHDVGGTWRDNTYPGAACDVPSHLYSYSFALNENWTRSFSRQPEIQQYMEGVARDHDVYDKHVFGCEVNSARWNTDTQRWNVQTSKGLFIAKIVISGIGVLTEPNLPDIKGIDSFEGEVFHSARWNHEADLTGKRVAIIGTGASAIQIVPSIAETVGHLDVYQRTAPWVLPRFDRQYTKIERFAFKHVPGFQRLSRAGIYATRETQVLGLTKMRAFMKPLELASRNHLMRQIKDKSLRAKVMPNFQIGCKRMLISNKYYPALARPNVDLVTDGIAEVRPNAVVTKDGTVREIDALIVATGFQVTDSPSYEYIYGKDGRSLAEMFEEQGIQAYKGSTVNGFPNFFFLVGPNTGLGHTSMVFMIESQLNYVMDAIRTIDRHDLGVVEVRKDVQDEFNADLQQKLAKTVWQNGGCASWYADKHGNVTTLWPGFTFDFRRITKKFDLAAYDSTVTGELPVGTAPTTTDKVASL